MPKCDKCSEVFEVSEVVAKCVDCKMSFHPSCTRLGSSQNFTKNKSKYWKCDSCNDDTTSAKSHEDVVEDKKSILEALNSMKNEINDNVNKQIGALKNSVDSLADDLKKLNTKVSCLEDQQEALATRCNKMDKERSELTDEVRELRLKLEDAEQHMRCANIEIVGLPLTSSEDVYACLEKIASAINVPYNREEISIAHRLRLYSRRHSHPPIIAQFVSRRVKETWIAAARRKKNLNASEVSPSLQQSQVFINEHLTAGNKALLGRARRLARERKLNYAGYINGKVLVKRSEGDQSVRVRTMDDLDKYE